MECDYRKLRDTVAKQIQWDEFGCAYIQHNGLMFHSFFQPIYDRSMEIFGVEALARIYDNNGDLVRTDRYFKSLEQDDDTLLYSTYMCAAIHVINFARSIYRSKCIFINVAPVVFELISNDSFAIESLLKKLDALQLKPEQIIYELIELQSHDYQLAVSGVKALESVNIRVAVDDFGVKSSTEHRVKIVQPSFLKLDRSLVVNAVETGCHGIEQAISLGRSTRSLIIAEGIENQAMLSHCQSCDIDFYQGYYLARPHKTPLA
ncbi:EAL domain-containing protein [Vibrio sp. 16]|uniref:EAL domain-containing protein n=1 Tax=Vibrio sp. 16 TaxID=391586 RepID=UPI00018F3FBF|nr:EAL domain-containing protein [Vibrio sp. 16]EED24699.1 FOG: EAL domain protein [Vibrio sp. 16]